MLFIDICNFTKTYWCRLKHNHVTFLITYGINLLFETDRLFVEDELTKARLSVALVKMPTMKALTLVEFLENNLN